MNSSKVLVNADSEKVQAQPEAQPPRVQISKSRKSLLLLIFCLVQFLDTFSVSSLYTALPTIASHLNMTGGESTWLISAYQLSLASFLLIGGRISDVYRPGPVFITGATGLSVLSIAAGFLREKIALIVFRALVGIFAALTIPSALALIIYFFPDPKEQASAIGGFGGCGTIGNVLGLIFGALLTQDASWPWVLWFIAIASAPIALGGFFLIPFGVSTRKASEELKGFEKVRTIDIFGITLLTIALVLFIFSMVSGSTAGWKSAQTLVPLIISISLIIAFFLWERMLPEGSAAIPPNMWQYPNFTLLILISLVPYALANVAFIVFTNYWQTVLGWSVLSTAVHLLPMTVTTIISIGVVVGLLRRYILSKWFLLFGLFLMGISLLLNIFAYNADRFWPFTFPAFVLGATGFPFVYMHANVALFHVTPPSASGTVGAIFNGAGQLGSAVGVAIATSIIINVDIDQTGHSSSRSQLFAGSAAAFEFYLGVTVVSFVGVLLFCKNINGTPRLGDKTEEPSDL